MPQVDINSFYGICDKLATKWCIILDIFTWKFWAVWTWENNFMAFSILTWTCALIQDGGQKPHTKPGEIEYFDKNLYYTVPTQVCHPSSVRTEKIAAEYIAIFASTCNENRRWRIRKRGLNELTCQPVNLLTHQPVNLSTHVLQTPHLWTCQ